MMPRMTHVGSGLVVQGYFRGERLAARTGLSPPRPALPAELRRTAVQAKAAARPDLLPGMGTSILGGSRRVGQAKSGQVKTTPLLIGQLALSAEGHPVEPRARQAMEQFFATDFASVRVHEGPGARRVGALAFTLGDHLHFSYGLYDPYSREGLELLGHELAHVVQQRAGRVWNPYGQGLALVQDPALEAEADALGRKAAAALLPATRLTIAAQSRPMQTGAGMNRIGWRPALRTVQPMQMPGFGAWVTQRFPDASILIMATSYDADRDSIVKTSQGFYKGLHLSVVNTALEWNVKTRKIPDPEKGQHQITGKLILVVTGHGNVHWMFSEDPSSEKKAAIEFAQALIRAENRYGCEFIAVILDSCWSATEIGTNESKSGVRIPCPARLLSERINVPVIGFNGKVSSNKVKYYDEHGAPQQASYGDNCVVFANGAITKGSTLNGHNEIWHDTAWVQSAYYQKQVFKNLVGPRYKSDLG